MSVPNVWTQMNYVPPRGHCNFKQSVLSPKCPCLRFMLHPLKSASSYECDGCSHHASFHNMENKVEDAICKRWEEEAKDKADRESQAQQRPKKRIRAIEYQTTASRSASTRKPGRVTASKSKGNGTVGEFLEDDDEEDVIELG